MGAMRRLLTTVGVLVTLLLAPCQFAGASASDAKELLNRVVTRLSEEAGLGAKDVVVQARRGTVWLEGEVGSSETKAAIEKIVGGVEGVDSVVNNLKVDPTKAKIISNATHAGLDDQVLEAIKAKGLRDYSIAVSSNKGVVSLVGKAANEDVVTALISTAKQVPGVQKVVSNIKIQPFPASTEVKEAVSDKALKERVAATLVRDYPEAMRQLEFSVTNGIVAFSGSVSEHKVIDQILSTTLMVDGVKDVESKVQVGR